MKKKIIRITTVPISLQTLLKGQHSYMSTFFEIVGISSQGKELEEVKVRENIKVIPLEMTRTISPFKDLISLIKLIKILLKEKPSIIHSHTPKAGIIAMLAGKIVGVPIRLHTVAGLPLMEASGKKRVLLDFVEKLTYRCATKIYPNSKGLYEFILKEKFTSMSKLEVIGNGSSNGIDTGYFSKINVLDSKLDKLRYELGILKGDFIFIFVGRLVGDKGINELIEAFDKFKLQKNVKLLLVGSEEGELDPLNNKSIHEIRNNKNIISVGYQNDVRPYFALSNCLVFPSYREGFPNVVMQAGSMGLPSIVSNINGCNEIIIEGQNGIIIPVKSSDAIFEAMSKIINDNDYCKNLTSKSRELIVERYEQNVLWESLASNYNKLLKNINA